MQKRPPHDGNVGALRFRVGGGSPPIN